jgi:effector-binding domain-containing protein
MLMLRRAQLEQELEAHKDQLLGVEARLRYIEREGVMPADDIVVKKLPAMGVVVIAEPAPAFGPENIVPVVNRAEEQFSQLRIRELVKEAGPYFIFYEGEPGNDLMVCLALPVAEPPAELPPPARYLVLPEVEEAAVTVRNGPAASIFPFVYHDLARWADERGYQVAGPGREVWAHMVDDAADVSQQVFEVQLPFSRPEATPS